MAAVLDRYGTGPLSFGTTFRIPCVKTEKTAKKRRKNEQKWARYSHLKRVRVADLLLMDRYAKKAGSNIAGMKDSHGNVSLGGTNQPTNS